MQDTFGDPEDDSADDSADWGLLIGGTADGCADSGFWASVFHALADGCADSGFLASVFHALWAKHTGMMEPQISQITQISCAGIGLRLRFWLFC